MGRGTDLLAVVMAECGVYGVYGVSGSFNVVMTVSSLALPPFGTFNCTIFPNIVVILCNLDEHALCTIISDVVVMHALVPEYCISRARLAFTAHR